MTRAPRRAFTGPRHVLFFAAVILIGQGSFYLIVGLVGLGHGPNKQIAVGASLLGLGLLALLILRRKFSTHPSAHETAQTQRRRALAVFALAYFLVALAALIYGLNTGSNLAGLQVVIFGSQGLIAAHTWLRSRSTSRF